MRTLAADGRPSDSVRNFRDEPTLCTQTLSFMDILNSLLPRVRPSVRQLYPAQLHCQPPENDMNSESGIVEIVAGI